MLHGLKLILLLLAATPALPEPVSGLAAAAKPLTAQPTAEVAQPPPSTYDLQGQGQGQAPTEDDPWQDPGTGMGMQILRSVIALMLVVGLIYVGGRVLAPRLLSHLPKQRGSRLRVVDRIMLDNKHALLVVEVADHGPLLLATGDAGVQVLPLPTARSPSFPPLAPLPKDAPHVL